MPSRPLAVRGAPEDRAGAPVDPHPGGASIEGVHPVRVPLVGQDQQRDLLAGVSGTSPVGIAVLTTDVVPGAAPVQPDAPVLGPSPERGLDRVAHLGDAAENRRLHLPQDVVGDGRALRPDNAPVADGLHHDLDSLVVVGGPDPVPLAVGVGDRPEAVGVSVLVAAVPLVPRPASGGVGAAICGGRVGVAHDGRATLEQDARHGGGGMGRAHNHQSAGYHDGCQCGDEILVRGHKAILEANRIYRYRMSKSVSNTRATGSQPAAE